VTLQKLANAIIRVNDVSEAVDFNVNVFGLKEMARDGDHVYLGCGLDNDYDLVLTSGGTGISQLAYQVLNEDELKIYQRRIEELGIKVEEFTDAEPGHPKKISFLLPSTNKDIRMDLVTVANQRSYYNPASTPHRSLTGAGPQDLDHLGIKVADGKKFSEFVTTALDFKLSDIFMPAPEIYAATWARSREYHHDLAFFGSHSCDETLDHIAWRFEGIEHMKRALDMMAPHGLQLEFGIGRHEVGANLFAYFWVNGNRYELSAEMPRVTDDHSEPLIWDDITKSMTAWRQLMPEGFKVGS
jgi:catechol 2,3-dioxygenase